jgi:putative aminopeptidase FrvX
MNKDFLIKYLKTDSPSTYEKEAQQAWCDRIREINPSANIKSDVYGNVYLYINGTGYMNQKVVIDAHADEIGWVIKSIDDNGFIYLSRNGGVDSEISPGTAVKILTDTKKVKGFFGWIPIHLKDRNNSPKPTIDNTWIDIGATSKKEVEEMGVDVGNYVVVDRDPEIINDKYVCSKAIDDKIGGFILSEVYEKLIKEEIVLPYDLYIVNSVQEEVGLRGATMITETIKPDIAICFDVCFDTNTPMLDKKNHGDYKMDDKLVLRQGNDVHPMFLKSMKEIAKNYDFDYKLAVDPGGGTNTFSYYKSNGGVVAGTVSIPIRYMHTPNEMASLASIEEVIEYYIALLQNIEEKDEYKFI